MKDIDVLPFPNIGNSPFYTREFNIGNMLPMMGSTKGFGTPLAKKDIENVIDDDNDEFQNQNKLIKESKKVNDKGDVVPNICPKCGSKIGVFLKGEPVYLCSNKKCNMYFGTVPCNVNESTNIIGTEEPLAATKIGAYSNDGIWNSLITMNGKKYRERAEALIFKDDKVFLHMNGDNRYRIPGGGTEPDSTISEQAIAESKEEARLNITDLKYILTYREDYIKKKNYMSDMPFSYDGKITHLYISTYESRYNGPIDKRDLDNDMYKFGRFYDINSVYNMLSDYHKKGVDKYRKNNIAAMTTESTFFSKEDSYVNIDLWKPNTIHNILFLTGLSGSGKTTLAKELCQKYKAEYIEMDKFTICMIRGRDNWYNKFNTRGGYSWCHPFIKEYIDNHNLPVMNGWQDSTGNKAHVDFIKWLQRKVNNTNKLYVCEGIQIAMYMYKYPNVDIVNSEPIVVKNTSAVQSIIRRIDRETNGDIKKVPMYLFKHMSSIPLELLDEIELNKFRKDYVESSLFSENDLVINYEKWEPGTPLWITGTSGDGKSTLANNLANDCGAIIAPTDAVLCRLGWSEEKWNAKADTFKTFANELGWEFVNSHPEWPHGFKEKIGWGNSQAYDSYFKEYFNWIIYNGKHNPKYNTKKIIIEGCDICTATDPEFMIKQPLIIIGCSRLQSSIRRIKRDIQLDNHNAFDAVFRELKRKYVSTLNDNKDFFKWQIETLSESVKSELDPSHKQTNDMKATYLLEENISYNDFKDIQTPEELSVWMKKNIKYDHISKFRSSDEVLKEYKGDCHDQAEFEDKWFTEKKIKHGRYFCVEYYDYNKPGGATHTFLWYQKNDKYYWFENAWQNQAGIHGPYRTIDNLLDDFKFKWKFSDKNDKLYLAVYKHVTPDSSFEEYVTKNTPEKDPTGSNSVYVKEYTLLEVAKVSVVDSNHKQKGKKSLNEFKKNLVTKEFVTNNEKKYSFLKYWKRDDSDITEYLYTDNSDKAVCRVAVQKYHDNNEGWIFNLDVFEPYKGYGLSKQLIDVAVKNLGGNYLGVYKNNKLAISIYKKYGFKESKIYKPDESLIYLTLKSENIEEATLSTKERNSLDESVFGIPELRKYPMPDKRHVESAIGYFNKVEPKYEKELAKRILDKMDEFGVDSSAVGEKNNLRKYVDNPTLLED